MCYIVNDMSKMRKFKMVTILLYGKNKLSYIHSQTSSDGLNLSTVHPPYMKKKQFNGKNSNELNLNTLFHKGSFTYLASTNL